MALSDSHPPQVKLSRAGGPGTTGRALEPEYIRKTVTEHTDDPDKPDYLCGFGSALSATQDEAFEPLLLRLIEQCEKGPERLSSQILQTRCALVDLYQRLEDEERVSDALEQAKKATELILTSPVKKTKHLLEACIKVASLQVENKKTDAADEMFQTIGWEAEDTFGTDSEDTISLLVRIGKMYQDENLWSSAKPWFERALAASMTQNGLYGTMTKRLEAALENEYYSVSVLTYEEVESIVRSRTDV